VQVTKRRADRRPERDRQGWTRFERLSRQIWIDKGLFVSSRPDLLSSKTEHTPRSDPLSIDSNEEWFL
jgi:hypothetical protein